MIPTITVARLRRPALVTSASGLAVLLATTWPAPPAAGGIRPTAIAATSRVFAPTIAAAPAGGIAPVAITSTAVVGQPVITGGGARPIIAPTRIESGAAVGAPFISPAVPGTIAPALIHSTAVVNAPFVQPTGVGAIAPTTIGPASRVGSPTIMAEPTIYNTSGDSQLRGDQVAGFADRVNALDARLTARGF